MKTIKPILTAAILSLALCMPVFAGDMSTPGATPPPPPPTVSITGDVQTPTTTSTAPGDMGTPGAASTAPGDMGTPGIALNILLALLSLF